MLTDHEFAASYTSEVDDLASELYLPAMAESVSYDRISGFFSSSVLMIAWPALRRFVQENDGTIRLLCSPRLAEADAEGLVRGYQARDENELGEQLLAELEEMLAQPQLRTPTRLLAALIASGTVDVRLAVLAQEADAGSRRMFHDKVGLFTDTDGNQVGFRGTFNETYLGLSAAGNVESVDVWTSWEDGKDLTRLEDANRRFTRLWNGEAPGVRILELPNTTLERLKELARDVDHDALLAEVELQGAVPELPPDPWLLGERRLRPHQQRAVTAWRRNDRRGLLGHATGSGKTVTGLFCIREALSDGLRPLVIVPSALLLEQWSAEIQDVLGCRVMACGGGHDRWRSGQLAAALDDPRERVIVAVAASAASPEFVGQVRRAAGGLMLVADEAHRLGSANNRRILKDVPAVARLGLSATPERAGDTEGTDVVFDYFGGVVDTYGIKDALADGVLAPYEYTAEFVHLDDQEEEHFEELTRKIKRQAAMVQERDASQGAKDRLKRLLIERSRVIKNAAAKPPRAADVLVRMHKPGDRWLVYCDNRVQVAAVRQALHHAGIESWEYFRGMEGDPANTLRAFDSNGGVVVSIRCLDEGVDIPAADHALILASSRNPREHIQRRGRVLRRAPFKTLATLVDVVTLPRALDMDDDTIGTVTGEMARAMEFARWSVTTLAEAEIRERWIELGLPLEELPLAATAGVETDGPDEEEQ